MSTILFVGHLSVTCDENSLYQVFSQVGPIQSIKLMRTRKKASLGYAFVTMNTIEDTARAINVLNGQLLCGREMKIGYGTANDSKNSKTYMYNGNGNQNNSNSNPNNPNNFNNTNFNPVDKVQAPLHMNSLLLRFSSSTHLQK